MKRKNLGIALTLLAWTAVLAVSAQDKPLLHLGTAARSAIFGDFVGVVTTFQNGFRPEWDYKQTWVRLYDSDGKLVRTNEVRVPGMKSLVMRDVSASRNGLVAVAASEEDPKAVDSGTILLFDREGEPRHVFRTQPFFPTHVTIAPDGYIWISGTDPKVEFWIRPEATPEQKRELCVLQKYTSDGVLVGSYLKRSTFDKKVLPWHGFLRSSASGVGLFVLHDDRSGEWVELSPEGDVTGRWTVPAPAEGVHPSPFGFADSGSVYADWHSNARLPAAGTYRLNKSTSRWDRVEDPQVAPPRGTRLNRAGFLGTDGDYLVFRTSYSPSEVVWFREPPKRP